MKFKQALMRNLLLLYIRFNYRFLHRGYQRFSDTELKISSLMIMNFCTVRIKSNGLVAE